MTKVFMQRKLSKVVHILGLSPSTLRLFTLMPCAFEKKSTKRSTNKLVSYPLSTGYCPIRIQARLLVVFSNSGLLYVDAL